MPIKDEPTRENADAFAPVSSFVVFRRLFTELMGAFLLVCVDCGGAITSSLSHGAVTPVARSLATGLIVMAMSSAMSSTSGAHFNPAVTTAFALRGAFPWKMVPMYWLAQIAGAFLGSAGLLGVFGDVEHLGATLPQIQDGMGARAALAAEIVTTMALVLVALGTATRHRVLGAQAAIATGGTIAACTLVARPISGASMNPARSLAPAVLSHTTGWLWIYIAGPLVGAVLAWLASIVIHTKKHSEERVAAGGEPK